MIFPDLKTEKILQVEDKTRLDASFSFSDGTEEITKIEIKPDASEVYVDVTSNGFLDYAYSIEGIKEVSVRLNDYKELHKAIEVITEEDDRLFSSDEDLLQCEPEILGFLQAGKNSYKNIHREAKTRILQRLNEKEIWDIDGNKLTDKAIIDIAEVREWSKYYTLELIFNGISNTVDDVFQLKGQGYRGLREAAEDRALIRLDIDGDSVAEGFSKLSIGFLNRR